MSDEPFRVQVKCGRMWISAQDGGGVYQFSTIGAAVNAIKDNWTQFGQAWKKRNLRIMNAKGEVVK